MTRLFLAAASAVVIANTASAGQPIYNSMVECGAIYTASAELIRSKPKKEMLNTAAKIWRAKAVDAVVAARMPDASRYVTMMHDEKLRVWRGKGSRAAFSPEYRDWTAYCLSLAGARGIDLVAN